MTSVVPATRRRRSAFLLGAAVLCLSASVRLGFAHADAVEQMRELGLPAAVRIPEIERRLTMLQEQAEAARLQAAINGGVLEEYVQAYVVPGGAEIDRLVSTLDALFAHWQQEGVVASFGGVRVLPTEVLDDNVSVVPVEMEAVLQDEGLRRLLLFIELSGSLTVYEALGEESARLLLGLTERENPAAVTALEHFLSTELLRYALEPAAYERLLLTAFSSDSFTQSFRNVTDASRLQDAVSLFGGETGRLLARERLWPLRMLAVRDADMERQETDDTVRIRLTVDAYLRGEATR